MSSTPNNGGTDRPATQKELLQAQLAAQEQLYLTVARVEQKLNDGFERVNLAVLTIAERMARLEGIRDATGDNRTSRSNQLHLYVLTVGMLISLALGVLGFVVPRP